FAKTYDIPVKKVIDPKETSLKEPLEEAFTDDGIMVNSDIFNGLSSSEGRKTVTEFLTEKGRGKKGVQYRLRDWGISRQRYWGNPIPVIYCKSCGTVPVPEEDLPVVLPEDVSFSGAESPLVKLPDFYEVECPRCSRPAKRETDTMDTFVQSSWYHMKYISPFTKKYPFESEEVNRAMPVNQYVGGIEHATGHLMYTRFFTKVLNDLGYINFREPIDNLLTQGMVCMETYSVDGRYVYPEEIEKRDGKVFLRENKKEVKTGRVEKMSKSKKNVVSPMEMVEKYGADTARLFVLFASPPQKDLEWSEAGIEGSYRFIKRIWSLIVSSETLLKRKMDKPSLPEDEQALFLYRKTHETIKKVKEDTENFAFNTAISALMELVNQCYKFSADTEEKEQILHFALHTLISLVNPFAPHFSEELYEMTGGEGCLSEKPFPEYSEKALVKKEITVVVQVNGKLRDKLTVCPEIDREEIEKIVRSKDYSSYLKSGNIKKVIYIPGRLVNVVG
ncbi:MAG: class I tRNA ligase family protein, partial [bacterium]